MTMRISINQSLGKTEAWYGVAAEPNADIAVGFKEKITARRMEEAARSGEIETLLDWRPVKAGDAVFVPAGTVHAIGAGVTICEIQQNSDITYRLYDYGRPRELHLEHGWSEGFGSGSTSLQGGTDRIGSRAHGVSGLRLFPD